MNNKADVIVIGAGIIGLSIAHELLKRGRSVLLLEKEKMPGMGETSKATGGIRLQFSSEDNIKLSLLSRERYLNFDKEFGLGIDFYQQGYLFMAIKPEHLEKLRQGGKLQKRLGVKTEFLTIAEVKRIMPAMKTDDILGGSICRQEGHADPSLAVQGYVKEVKQLGGVIVEDREVIAFLIRDKKVYGVTTAQGDFMAPVVINAAGPFSAKVAALAGIDLPITAHKRHVMVTAPLEAVPDNLPLVIDMESGWYMKKENRGGIIMGGTDRKNLPADNDLVDQPSLYGIIEAAVSRVPVLAEAHIVTSFAGLRSMSPDDHAILGQVSAVSGFYCAAGFSGHGFMHAPAVGMIMADLIIQGKTNVINMDNFSPERFLKVNSVKETYVF